MTVNRDDLTAKQLDYAVFLPAISGFYATYIGKQRVEHYVDPARMPQGLTDMEQMNWLNSQKALFPYKWSLYSGGHANLDLTKDVPGEDMVRKREAGTVILGDSGGFQIAKGLWEGDWRAPTSQGVLDKMADCVARKTEVRDVASTSTDKNTGESKTVIKKVTVDLVKEYQAKLDAAQSKRESVLKWLDGVSDYAMTLDIPTWIVNNPEASARVGITTEPTQGHQDAINATHYNNEYFIKHRKGVNEGGTKILNVLQGADHVAADEWYELMKGYCDPAKYPGRHFDGWAMGGQNMCDVHLILRRLVALRYDGFLQEGVHDWMHFLGTSKLEWAVLLTAIQRAVRKYVNPSFTISFDCASPFLATANGQVYYENVFPNDSKWGFRMAPSADHKKYAIDTRPWATGVKQDGIHNNWTDSPLSKLWKMNDICIYKPGAVKAGVDITDDKNFHNPASYDILPDTNKNGKWGKTSWDSYSYALLMGHNVYMHLTAVQEANRQYDAGNFPSMMRRRGDYTKFEDIVEAIFAAPDRETSDAIIEHYTNYWMEIIGGRGRLGQKVLHAEPMFRNLFEFVDDAEEDPVDELDETALTDLENS